MHRADVSIEPRRPPSFRVRESLDGVHEFARGEGPRGEFPFSLRLDWGPERTAAFLNPLDRDAFLTAAVRGVIRAGGWVDEAPCEGTLELRCFREAVIRTRLYFRAGGHPCEWIGQRVGLRPWNLHRTATVCRGVAYDLETGREVSRSLARWRVSSPPRVRLGRSPDPVPTTAG